jgi:hypothetical protein
MKGCYDYIDLNRVGEAVALLAEYLQSYGYSVTVDPKTDWSEGDEPTASQRAAYLADVAAIKAAFYGTTELPAAMDNINHEDANNIEALLVEVDTYIAKMIAGFRKCGSFKSGQGLILP